MEKKRNLPPESSQLVEPQLEQHKSEAEQENLPVQEEKEDDQAFEQSPTSPFGQTNSPAFGSSSTSFGAFEQSSTSPFGQTNSLLGASCSPAFGSSMRKSSSTPAFGSSSTSFGGSSGFCQKPAFGGFRLFGSTMPTNVRKHLEAVWKQFESEAIQTAEQAAFGATSTPTFGARRLYPVGEPSSNPSSIISHPAITEEDGGTSGQTAKLDGGSCFAIAGVDYCFITADITLGHTKISELSRKSVMASCGFQADVKALQEALSAENLVPYVAIALVDSKLDAEGRKDLFDWLSRQFTGLSSLSEVEAAQLLKPAFAAINDKSSAVRKAAATCIKEVLRLSGIHCHGTTVVCVKNQSGLILAVDSRISTNDYRIGDEYIKFYRPCSNILIVASGNEYLFRMSTPQMMASVTYLIFIVYQNYKKYYTFKTVNYIQLVLYFECLFIL